MLSEPAQALTRKIDQVFMSEAPKISREIYCFDIFPFENIEESEEAAANEGEREIGDFIKHVEFDGVDPVEYETVG